MDSITFRQATAADADRIAQIMHGEPGQEAAALAGSVELARAWGMSFVRLKGSPQGWEHTVIAERDGVVVGILQAGKEARDMNLTPRMFVLALRTFGVRLPSVLPRLRARARVQPASVAGAYHISEIHVDSAFRNQGIGSALLAFAESQARQEGCSRMSLTTTTANPARHLYERHGFTVAETKTDPSYQRCTGIEGRICMAKVLSSEI